MKSWGEVELEPEVRDWYCSLSVKEQAIVFEKVEALGNRGPLHDEPYTRQLDGKLRELRFHLGTNQQRITYYIATGRRIILLTVFRKTKQVERREVARAKRAMEMCITEGHTAED